MRTGGVRRGRAGEDPFHRREDGGEEADMSVLGFEEFGAEGGSGAAAAVEEDYGVGVGG